MEIATTRTYASEPGDWFNSPSLSFVLHVEVSLSHEERWVIEAHNLYHYTIVDRTPSWYYEALKRAQRSEAQAQQDGIAFEWPWHVPRRVPEEWIVTAGRVIREPAITVTFDTAAEMDAFEPRLLAAFQQFAQFLKHYGARPKTMIRRF